MDKKYFYQLAFVTFLILLLFWSASVFSGGGYLYLRRFFFGVVVLIGGLILPSKLVVIPSIFAISADYTFFQHKLNSLDLLLWALFISLPYLPAFLAANFIESEAIDKLRGDSLAEETEPETRNNGNSDFARIRGTEDQLEEPDKIVRELIRLNFEQAFEELSLANLLYFHVRNQQASLGYKINNYGKINENTTFTPDIGQSVGWVLRHEESFVLQGQSLDWRNLQYHSNPVDLSRVEFHPVTRGERLIGVLALEWQKPDTPADEAVDTFCSRIEKLFGLDYSVQQVFQSKEKLKLLEKLYSVNPLAAADFDGTINKVLEIVSSYLPADEIDFYGHNESLAAISPPARRKVYESCRQWICNTEEILRLDNVNKESLGGTRLDKFGQAGVSSFLGGGIKSGEGLYGLIFLADEEPEYFTREDKKIFRLLLDYLEQLLEIATSLQDARRARDQLSGWVDEVTQIETKDNPAAQGKKIIQPLHEFFKPLSTGLYWRNNSYFELVSYYGGQKPSEAVDVDNSLISGISGSDGALLTFPDVNKFSGFEAPLDTESLVILSVTTGGGKLVGFIVLCFENQAELEGRQLTVLEETAGLIDKWLFFNYRAYQDKLQARQDSLTPCLNYSAWLKQTQAQLRQDPEVVLFWELWVPGQEKVGNACGRKKTVNWLHSIARLLQDKFAESLICRPYGAVFYGFQKFPDEEVEAKLQTVQTTISDWAFPAGEWPGEVEYEFDYFSPPFSRIEKILDNLHYSRGETNNNN